MLYQTSYSLLFPYNYRRHLRQFHYISTLRHWCIHYNRKHILVLSYKKKVEDYFSTHCIPFTCSLQPSSYMSNKVAMALYLEPVTSQTTNLPLIGSPSSFERKMLHCFSLPLTCTRKYSPFITTSQASPLFDTVLLTILIIIINKNKATPSSCLSCIPIITYEKYFLRTFALKKIVSFKHIYFDFLFTFKSHSFSSDFIIHKLN